MPFGKGKNGGAGWDPTGLAQRSVPRDIAAQSEAIGTAAVRAGAPGKVGRGSRVQVLLPPHIYPPYNAAFFFGGDSASFVGAVVQKFTGTQAKVTIPQGNVGVVRELTLYVNNLTTSSQIQFNVLVNGSPVEGYGLIVVPQISAAVWSFSPDDVYIRVNEGNTVEMRAIVTDVVTYTLAFELRGWSYGKEIDAWWAGAGM